MTRYARPSLWRALILDLVLGAAIIGASIAGAAHLARRFGAPAAASRIAVVVLLLPVLVSVALNVYRIAVAPSVAARVGFDPAAGRRTGGDPDALLRFETEMVAVSRPFAWARAVANAIVSAGVLALVPYAWLRLARLPDMPLAVISVFAAIIVLGTVAATVSDIYRTWATYAVPLDRKTAVVSKPVERVLLVTHLGLIAAFTSFFLLAPSRGIAAFGAVTGVGTGALAILRYRRTVSRPIVEPLDVAPIGIDPAERIEVSLAGIVLGAAGPFRKSGFGRRTPQAMYAVQSGRRLDPWAQNALLASETRLYFIHVPVGLGEQTQFGDASLESLFAGAYVRATLDEMLRTMTVERIYRSHPINFAVELSDVERIAVVESSTTRRIVALADREGGELRVMCRSTPELNALEAFAARKGISSDAASA